MCNLKSSETVNKNGQKFSVFVWLMIIVRQQVVGDKISSFIVNLFFDNLKIFDKLDVCRKSIVTSA